MSRFADVNVQRRRAKCWFHHWGTLKFGNSQLCDRAQAMLCAVGIDSRRIIKCELMVDEAAMPLVKIALDPWFELAPMDLKPVKLKV